MSEAAGHRPSLERRIDRWASERFDAAEASGAGRLRRASVEVLAFGLKQAWACIFGAALLAVIIATRLVYPDDALIVRSDFLVLAAIAIQILMLTFRLESGRELWVIVLFHVVGTVMEIFKTDVGSWSYEGIGWLRIGAVPLYTGFMYASIGSYMVRVYRLFDLRFRRYPPIWLTALLAAAIYANFFTHHWGPDLRWLLIGAAIALYFRCRMYFRNRHTRPWAWMPILASFAGVTLFIWVAENIGTAAGAWIYPDQVGGWQLVSLAKLTSWFLLMLISVVLVTLVYPPKPPPSDAALMGGDDQ